MAMNIFMREARDIVGYLGRCGYAAKIEDAPSRIVVQDPVHVLATSENPARTEYKDVVVRDWPAAIHFVNERA